jgi:hypothetical protein
VHAVDACHLLMVARAVFISLPYIQRQVRGVASPPPGLMH